MEKTLVRSRPSSRFRASRDDSSLATGMIIAELSELLNRGAELLCQDLLASQDALLAKLNQVWTTFFTAVLPLLEGIFWVLRVDARLSRAAADGAEGSISAGRVDITKLALASFRDIVVLPLSTQLSFLLQDLYRSRRSSMDPTFAPPPSSTRPLSKRYPTPPPQLGEATTSAADIAGDARRRQMLAVLASILTADEPQQEMDQLLRALRTGSTDKRRGSHDPPGVPGEVDVLADEGTSAVDVAEEAEQDHASQLSRTRINSIESNASSDLDINGGGLNVAVARKRRGFLPRLSLRRKKEATA